ncbi:MAG: hypothetical protein GY679_02970 [Mycoplasma sp.]|nr:hypothetical protein [Mycoplasma sp.]
MGQFIVESKQILFEQDLSNFRKLYAPILGPIPTSLYLYLFDICQINNYKTDYKPLKIIKNFLHTNEQEFVTARKTLEAVGLIQTFSKQDEAIFLFVIIKPLSINKFLKNKILWNKLNKTIGEIEAEKIIFNNKTNQFNKDNFIDITSKYHDIFELKEQNIQTTKEIKTPDFNDKNQAIQFSSPELFVRFISKYKPSPSFLFLLKDLKTKGMSDHSINLIIDYSYQVNGKIVSKYIETIAYNLLNDEINSVSDVKRELENALKQKNKKISENNTISKQKDFKEKGGDLNIEEIFSDLFS